MVVLTIVTQKNGETVYFSQPLPKVYFIKLLSCTLYNSWDTLKNEGSAALRDRKLNPSGTISKLPTGNYNLDVLAKKMTNLFLKFPYDGFIAETNSPLGQLVLENIGGSQIGLDPDLAKQLETE